MKTVLFILALVVVGCSTPDNPCGQVTNKQAFYRSSDGMYDYTIFIGKKKILVSESQYKSISKGDTFCE